MQTSVTFKNIDASEHLKSYAKDKLSKFDKYLDNPIKANVVLTVEKFRHIADINLSGDKLNINGKEETGDMYSAIDLVLDKLEIQIKKTKEKIKKHRGGTKNVKNRVKEREIESLTFNEKEDNILIKNIEYKPMDIDEAAMQLDISEDNFIVFTNSHTKQVNVIYRRKSGQYGLIQPNN